MRFSDKLSRLRPMGADGRARPGLPTDERVTEASRADVTSPAVTPTPAVFEDDGRRERIDRLRALMGGVMQREQRRGGKQRARAPQPLPVGQLVDHGHGPMYYLERYLEPSHCHGRVPVTSALSVAAELVGLLALDPALAGVDLSRLLILDTETTGLAGGTGTVPFLIGLAFFEDGVLKVEQLFLPNLGAEVPLLRYLAGRIDGASCVVSYNGKTFDWPLLRSRYILNRVAAPELPPHLDLLHCARRVFKDRLERVKLTDVEREILGFQREGDVPGSEIPGLYMHYLRGGDPRCVVPILEHNELDVVALASLLGEMGRHFGEVQRSGDPRDHFAYARVAARGSDRTRARRFAAAAAEGAEDATLRVAALSLSADLARREGDLDAALSDLHAALSAAPDALAQAGLHLALSKLHEHQRRDPASAYRHARHTELAEGPEAHGRRRGRLHRRLLR